MQIDLAFQIARLAKHTNSPPSSGRDKGERLPDVDERVKRCKSVFSPFYRVIPLNRKGIYAIRRIKTYGFFAPFFSAFALLTKERSGR
ncbi:hypothetical protein HMPREF0971_03270 [Segatella oris F0302]|uniref:Uncharacterized protein n=1 Tax=Segatella oris F0302 TaxID=649760 RepID=D1QW75_9BACT|nr:hypothetical protein HMPREF0971_03270 [Segatella oris F0302]